MDISRSVGRFRYVLEFPFCYEILFITQTTKLLIYFTYHCVPVMYNTYALGKKGKESQKGDIKKRKIASPTNYHQLAPAQYRRITANDDDALGDCRRSARSI